jgi:uncharacterized protein (TIGR03084 family)
MSASMPSLIEDLRDEHDALDVVVGQIDDAQWQCVTPSPGWSVADQIAHLTYFDEAAALAMLDPGRFRAHRDELVAHAIEHGIDQSTLAPLRRLNHHQLLERWRAAFWALDDAAAGLAEDARIEWFGPSMGAKSFLSARLMETWAHGTDIVDALGAYRPPTERLIHIAQLGFNTRRWSYQVRGETMPDGDVRLVLLSPAGATWTFGPDDAEDTVSGLAEEFCLVVTQRRHVEDTSLRAGRLGMDWLRRAQAFAGSPTSGPARVRS